MRSDHSFSRRSFLVLSAAAPWAVSEARAKKIPIGLELYSVRDVLSKDLKGTVTAVAKMGYQVVEFYSPYYSWTSDYAREVRKLMDDLGIRCNSTHNDRKALTPEGLPKAIELNHILGARYIVMASPGRMANLDDWKRVADVLSQAAATLRKEKLRAGYHNHKPEFVPVEGKRPIEIIAANTPKQVMLQLDVGTCLEAGSDPVSWIRANPGRINSLHLKDWTAAEGQGFRVLLGEGSAPWKDIFKAAESAGGVKFYLIEQEGSRLTSLETAQQCLANFNKIRA